MLAILRKGAQSWGIKILFAIIIIVFVFTFGMSRVQSTGGNVLATVNEEPILVTTYQQKLQRSLDIARSQNPGLTSEILMQMGIKQQIFDQMVTEELLKQKAAELGITVTKEELANHIHLIPAFHNEANVFDPEIYKNVLRNNNLQPGTFESDFMDDLLIEKLTSYVSATGKMTEDQVRDIYNYGMTKATISYLMYPWDAYTDQVNASAEQISKYYEDNKVQYLVPAQAQIAYIEITPSTLAEPGLVAQEDIEKFYAKNKEQFKIEEQVNARHLLIRVDENAADEDVAKAMEKITLAQNELAEGKDFAQVAETYTEDPSGTLTGGALGWFGRGRMVPAFEEVAFTLEPGQISDPVRTQFGFHLIQVEEKKPGGYQDFEEARPVIVESIARDRAMETLQDYLDQALELIFAGKNIHEVAQNIGLQVQAKETAFFNKDRGPIELPSLSKENIAVLFDLHVNATTQSPMQIEDGYLLATKIQDKEATTRPLEDVREAIVDIITRQEALKLSQSAADTDIALLVADEKAIEHIISQKNSTLAQSQPFSRQEPIADLGQNQMASQAIFNAQPNSWLPESYAFQDGYALIKVLEALPPSDEEWEQEKEEWIPSLNQRAEQQLLQGFIAELHAAAKITILNQAILAN